MSDDDFPSSIGPADQALFDIEDPREREERLREQLTPKLKEMLDHACALIEDVYGDESLDLYEMMLTPTSHRGANEIMEDRMASAALVIKGERQPRDFQLRIECSRNELVAKFFGRRGREANSIIAVLQDAEDETFKILNYTGLRLALPQFSDDAHDSTNTDPKLLTKLSPHTDRAWDAGVALRGRTNRLPFANDSWASIDCDFEFVAMFPFFRAATGLLMGENVEFLSWAEEFWEWDKTGSKFDERERWYTVPETHPDAQSEPEDSEGNVYFDPNEDLLTSAIEGQVEEGPQKHRRRERRLRDAKIQQALRDGNGRLKCEVPGCGFDFLAVYGELGRDFAVVHHKNLLSDRAEPELTHLDDLAIVCANCHAMIHRGNQNRKLVGLIPQRR